MNSEQIFDQIETEVRAICAKYTKMGPPTPEGEFANKIATVFYAGERIARGWGFDWIDGEGYPSGYFDAVLKGMRHNLKVEHYPANVREFYAKFL
jgi:hypothetical protein